MQTQGEQRVRKRLHCTLNVEARRHSGLILNLSGRGLFVQTSLPAEPGTRLAVDVRDPTLDEAIPLEAAVVWRRRVSPLMTGVNQSGMGLRLLTPPDAWQRMMSVMLAVDRPSEPPPAGREDVETTHRDPALDASPSTPPPATFIVRLAAAGGPRSRRLVVVAESESAARSRALREAGTGWTVLEIRRH